MCARAQGRRVIEQGLSSVESVTVAHVGRSALYSVQSGQTSSLLSLPPSANISKPEAHSPGGETEDLRG